MSEKLPFRPLFARVLLERPKVEKVGSIIIPESIQSRHAPAKGTILAVGDTCDESVKALVNREVLFAKFAGDWIKIGEKEYFICMDEDILGETYE